MSKNLRHLLSLWITKFHFNVGIQFWPTKSPIWGHRRQLATEFYQRGFPHGNTNAGGGQIACMVKSLYYQLGHGLIAIEYRCAQGEYGNAIAEGRNNSMCGGSFISAFPQSIICGHHNVHALLHLLMSKVQGNTWLIALLCSLLLGFHMSSYYVHRWSIIHWHHRLNFSKAQVPSRANKVFINLHLISPLCLRGRHL